MKIKDKYDFSNHSKPMTFSPQDYVADALNMMCEKNIGSIIVTNPDETIAGIVTERDMMRKVLANNLDTKTTKLSDIMSTTIRAAHKNDDLMDWMYTMSTQRFRHLPIVDDERKLIGVMSQGDFLAHTYPDLYQKIRQDLKGRLGKWLQIFIILFAIVALGLIALGL